MKIFKITFLLFFISGAPSISAQIKKSGRCPTTVNGNVYMCKNDVYLEGGTQSSPGTGKDIVHGKNSSTQPIGWKHSYNAEIIEE